VYAHIKQWIDYSQGYLADNGVVVYLDFDLNTPVNRFMDEQALESKLAEYLEYYSAYMELFATAEFEWRSVYSHLKSFYENVLDRKAAENKGARGASAAARVESRSLEEAVDLAETKMNQAKTKYKNSELYRDLVSRKITVIEANRRVTRHL